MELPLITAGQIVNTHGIRGEVKLLPQGLAPEELTGCTLLYIGGRPYTCTASRIHKGCLLAKLEGVGDMDAALALKGCQVKVRREDVPLPPGEYFDEELVGLAVRDAETGEALGKLEEVLSYPAHKIYVVRGGRDEVLIPAVPAFIAGIDMAGGTVDVYMMEGLGIHEN